MARPTDFVDPDYDKRLAEFKARRAEMKREMAENKPKQEPVKTNSVNSNNVTRRY